MGLVVVGIHAGTWDLLPDPLGWLLVLYGVLGLPRDAAYRTGLLSLGGLALVAAGPLWLPTVVARLDDADPSLRWAVNLPQLGFLVLLGWAVAELARRGGDTSAFRTWRTVATFAALCALLPILVWGGGVASLEVPSYVLASLTLLAAIVLAFAHSGRPWAVAPRPATPDDENGPDPRRDRGRSQT
jgi:hypothetical protein